MLQLGWLWPCPQIRRPDWKGFPRTNALAYSALSSVSKEKKFFNNDIRSTAEAGERSSAHQETDRYLQSYTSKLDRFSIRKEYISIMKRSSLQNFPFSCWQGFVCLMKPRHDTQHNTIKLYDTQHICTLSILTLSIMFLWVSILSIKSLSIECRYSDSHYNESQVLNCYAEWHYAECCHAESRGTV